MAVGTKIVSVYNGAADKDAFEEITLISDEKTHHYNYSEKTISLHNLYKQVREIRKSGEHLDELENIFGQLKTDHRGDWLCALEILEILYHQKNNKQLEKEIQVYLEIKASKEADHTKLINDGLHVIKNPVNQLIEE
jgi:phenylalanine-4-hydroxylase